MGLFIKHKTGIDQAFKKVMQLGTQVSESEFLDSLNLIVKAVEESDAYKTNEKLKIYELLQQIANCTPQERKKYAKKLISILK